LSAWSNMIAEGFQLHQAGKLTEAARRYSDVLAEDPSNCEARALLGAACLSLGQTTEAIIHLREALRINPDHAGARDNLGVALAKAGQLEEAVAHLRSALSLRPTQPETLANLGKVLVMSGQYDEAIDLLRRAVKTKTSSPQIHFHLAQALTRQGRLEEAVDVYRAVIALKPDYTIAMVNLGSLLCDLGQMAEAEALLRDAVRLSPSMSEAWNNLGSALIRQHQYGEAEDALRHALSIAPNDADPHYNLGFVLLKRSRPHEAIDSFSRAAELRPDYAKAHFNRAVTRLLLGDFERGWAEYEWRWQCSEFAPRTFSQPRWDGSSLNGRTIYLFAEQGLGDTLQFVRYSALVTEKGARVIVEVPGALLPLLSRTPGIDHIIEAGAPMPPFDVQAPLMSLPRILRTQVDDIPCHVPYVFPDPQAIQRWNSRLRGEPGLRVGIAWQGNPRYRDDLLRSIPLSEFGPLAQMEGVRLFSLQRGPGTDQLATLPPGMAVTDLGCSDNNQPWTFMDTAAVIRNLDLVIACDTVVVHLAGALGVPVWVLLPTSPDWRWLLEREDSPWYPTMKLYRQAEQKNWSEVISRVAMDLEALVRRTHVEQRSV